jgi:uridine kinase
LLSPDLELIMSHLREQAFVSAPTFVIDGPSGSGKTTLAAEIAQRWGRTSQLQVIHMDDLYPGWSGLAQGAQTAADLMRERALGKDVSWQRYDWSRKEFTQSFVALAHLPLLVEGCGSLSSGVEHCTQARLWLGADDELRRERALSRTGENFAEHWNEWDAQFEAFVALHNPQARATLEVCAS